MIGSGRIVAALACASTLTVSAAGAQVASDSVGAKRDTTRTSAASPPLFTHTELVAGVGAIASTFALAPFDRRIQRGFQDSEWQANPVLHHASRTLSFAGGPGPFIASAALYGSGLVFQRPVLRRTGVDLMEGVLLAAAIDGLGKGITGRALPDARPGHPGDFSWGRGFHDNNGSYVSFPSGHTAASFAAAAVVTGEAAHWAPSSVRIVAPVAYGTATLVAFARVYQNVHWASDLPLGAAIGIWSGTHVVAWNDRPPRNRFERWVRALSAAPEGHRRAALIWSSAAESAR